MPALNRTKTEAHEKLYPELERLTRQVEAMTKRNPAAPVPPATSAIAADLLFEAQRFSGGRRGLPEIAADVGGLATQLGRALARLDAFEAAYAAWDPRLNCFVWALRDPLPVRRLRQQSATMQTAQEERDGEAIRAKFMKRFTARIETAYEDGYRHATEGREPQGAFGSTSSERPAGTS